MGGLRKTWPVETIFVLIGGCGFSSSFEHVDPLCVFSQV